ncbi:hypothetical protein ACJIZ3_000548 [Penstemon smallii]|uniref:Uncharacterized protein n=1 Tax=Penstemon smallii TaxID=265156 RepID=A0ABD3R4T9_9LAMI
MTNSYNLMVPTTQPVTCFWNHIFIALQIALSPSSYLDFEAYRSSMISLFVIEWVSSEYLLFENPSHVGSEYFGERTWGGDDIGSCDLVHRTHNLLKSKKGYAIT